VETTDEVVYAAVFMLVNLAFRAFEREAPAQAKVEEVFRLDTRITRTQLLLLGMCVIAVLVALKFPAWGFGLVCCVLLVYLRPEALEFR
jgi:hypothetical protein